MTEPIRLLFGSDFHFGTPEIDDQEMAEAFSATIFPLLPQTDILFLNGDFFDRMVIFDNHGFAPIYDTIMMMYKLCQQYQVKLRILQGTWTHDRSQCRHFETFYRNHYFTFDFRYWDTIALEEIPVGGRSLRVLYIPDDLPYRSSDDLLIVVEEKLLELGWAQIDYACLHGFCDFTFPKDVKQDGIVYRESQFHFVKKLVDVGHVHQFRIEGKMASNGSFDRLVFGDEDPKGCIRVEDYPDHYTAHFVENTRAACFDTLVFTKDDTTETIAAKITAHLETVSKHRRIHLRFTVELDEHKVAIKDWMREVHPTIRIKFKSKEDKDGQVIVLPKSDLFITVEKRIAPTPKTIATFIRAEIPDSYDITIEQIETHLDPA